MILFIANRIKEARVISLEGGQAKYRAYFIATHLYEKYRLDVEAILLQDDCADCIVLI